MRPRRNNTHLRRGRDGSKGGCGRLRLISHFVRVLSSGNETSGIVESGARSYADYIDMAVCPSTV